MQTDKEFPSLLFTPRAQDRQAESSYRSRSPRLTRSPSTPAHGRNSGLRESSRRKSLTPTSGTGRDSVPAPPPFLSIWDADRGKSQPALPSDDSGFGQIEVQAPADTDGEVPQDTWVTVFGFTAQDQHIVLREFAKCGNILQFGSGREDRVNWIHIHYSSPFHAQRALLKGGQVLSGRVMIGVKPMEQQFRLAAESLSGDSKGRLSSANTKRILVRPQRLDSSGGQNSLPASRNSTWAKISEFVLGG